MVDWSFLPSRYDVSMPFVIHFGGEKFVINFLKFEKVISDFLL